MVFDRWDHFEVSARTLRSSLLHTCLWSESSSPLKEVPLFSPLVYSFFSCFFLKQARLAQSTYFTMLTLYSPTLILFFVPVSATIQMYQCPYCKFTNTDLNRLRMHVMTQHSVQPMLRCPLCQDMLNNKIHLQFHLTHLHSVAPDCVDKLIATVSPVCVFVCD